MLGVGGAGGTGAAAWGGAGRGRRGVGVRASALLLLIMDVSFLDGGRGGGRVGVLIVGALDDEAAFRHRAPHLPPALSLLASATEKVRILFLFAQLLSS